MINEKRLKIVLISLFILLNILNVLFIKHIWDFARCFIISAILFVAAYSDILKNTIPDRLSIFLFILGALFYILKEGISISECLLGGFSIFILLGMGSLITKGNLGFGDVKILSALGMNLGFIQIWSLIFYAAILSLIAGIFMIFTKRAGLKDKLPFIPFILVGFYINIFYAI